MTNVHVFMRACMCTFMFCIPLFHCHCEHLDIIIQLPVLICLYLGQILLLVCHCIWQVSWPVGSGDSPVPIFHLIIYFASGFRRVLGIGILSFRLTQQVFYTLLPSKPLDVFYWKWFAHSIVYILIDFRSFLLFSFSRSLYFLVVNPLRGLKFTDFLPQYGPSAHSRDMFHYSTECFNLMKSIVGLISWATRVLLRVSFTVSVFWSVGTGVYSITFADWGLTLRYLIPLVFVSV